MTCSKKVKFIRIDGSTPAQNRGDLVNKFQQNSDVRVAILSINAAGTGLTLTVSLLLAVKTLHPMTFGLCQALKSSANQTSSQQNCAPVSRCCTHVQSSDRACLALVMCPFCDPCRVLQLASYLSASQAISNNFAPWANLMHSEALILPSDHAA